MRRAIVALGLVLAACGAPSMPGPSRAELGPNDVSVLLPLPSDGDYSAFLGPGSMGNGGPLIPVDVFNVVPEVNPMVGAAPDPHAVMHVVAIRFDPCFTATAMGSACEPQIRMILQGVIDGPTGPVDGAMHAFYRLDHDAFADVVAELRRLHDLAPENASTVLGPSPAIVAQGIHGAYATGLFALVLQHAGAATLRRVTFMQRTAARETQWKFGLFEVEGGVATRANVAELDMDLQTVNLMLGTGPQFQILPYVSTQVDLTPILTTDAAAMAAAPDREAAYRAALALENPTMHVPDEVQCAACHVASPVARHCEMAYGLDTLVAAERFATDRTISTTSDTASDPNVMRIFGWFEGRPAVAPRAVHETAAVLDVIDADYPPPT